MQKFIFNIKIFHFKDVVGTGKKQLNFSEVDIATAKDYAAEDTDITLRLYKLFYQNLRSEKLLQIYENFEKPMVEILAKMEINGVKIDKNFLAKLIK